MQLGAATEGSEADDAASMTDTALATARTTSTAGATFRESLPQSCKSPLSLRERGCPQVKWRAACALCTAWLGRQVLHKAGMQASDA